LPDIAGKRGFRVDLVLVHVDRFAEQLLDRADHGRVPGEKGMRLVVQVGGEGGAGRARTLSPDLGPVLAVDGFGFGRQQRDLGRSEGLGQEQVAVLVEISNLGLGQHDWVLPLFFVLAWAARCLPVRLVT